MKFIVRKAEEKDLQAIQGLYTTKKDYPHSPYGKEKREIFRNMLGDRSGNILVGERNGIVSAFISLKIEHRFENKLLPSAIISDLRAEDNDAEILCAILSRAIAVAMENECNEITLFDKNLTAEKYSLYSICGFKENPGFFRKQI
ncbi:MAG: hypothetical protein IKL16_05700 [Clostridia bacterium]|nr:hypothetical protein [Clostridia bacterium]